MSSFYPPTNVGGIELYTHGLAYEMQRRGHVVHVACVGTWDSGKDYYNGFTQDNYQGVDVTRLNLNWRKANDPFKFLYHSPVIENRLVEIICKFKPSVIHVTSPAYLSLATIWAADQANVPVVLSLCDFWCICPRHTLKHADGNFCDAQVSPWECTKCLAWNAKIYRWPRTFIADDVLRHLLTAIAHIPVLSRQHGMVGMIGDVHERRKAMNKAFENIHRVLAVSPYVKDVVEQSGLVFTGRTTVLAQGLPVYSPVLTHSPTTDSSFKIAYFGRIAPIKGVDTLIKAFALLRGDAKLSIHGNRDGGSEEYDQQLAALAGNSPRISFYGPYNREDLATLMTQMDVIVVPSVVAETYCMVAREAQLNGIPVIGTDIGAIPDIIQDGVNGLLYEPGDVSGLARHLQHLLDNPSVLQELRANASSSKTISQECGELEVIYQSLLYPATSAL